MDRFLLARLSVDSLLDKRTKAKVESALSKLSKGSKSSDQAYGEAYKDAIERIESQLPEDRKLAKIVISWITYAKRQLTTKQLGEALAVEPGDSELNEDNIPDAEDILSVCCGLVTVDKESQVVRLIHYTTQEYFEKIRDEWNPTAQLQIASTCLTYLSFKPFKAFQWDDIYGYLVQKAVEPYALLEYAAQNWGPHASAIQQDVSEQACTFLQDINLVACINKVLNSHEVIDLPHVKKFRKLPLDSMARDATGLHLAARLGLDHILEKVLLLPNSVPADAKNEDMQTPLTWAVIWGNLAAVEVLLKRDDVDPNYRHNRYVNCEEDPATDDFYNDDFYNDPGWSALSFSSALGNESFVRLLMKRDDVNVVLHDFMGRTPLTWAVLGGHKEVVKLFLERDGVDVDSKDFFGRRPLFYAAGLDTETIARLFLERGADVSDSKDDDDDYTLLSYAAIRGCPATIQLLLERGVDPNLERGYLGTPLHHAVTRHDDKGCAAIVELLLKHGAKTDLRNKLGETPLHAAHEFYVGHETQAAVLQLLAHGADPDVRNNAGETPLLSIMGPFMNQAAVKHLLDYGATPDARNNMGETPLHLVPPAGLKREPEPIVELLLQHGAKTEVRDNNGKTPLHWAVGKYEDGPLAAARKLLEYGAKTDSEDNTGRTPLADAIEHQHRGMILLLETARGIGRETVEPGHRLSGV